MQSTKANSNPSHDPQTWRTSALRALGWGIFRKIKNCILKVGRKGTSWHRAVGDEDGNTTAPPAKMTGPHPLLTLFTVAPRKPRATPPLQRSHRAVGNPVGRSDESSVTNTRTRSVGMHSCLSTPDWL